MLERFSVFILPLLGLVQLSQGTFTTTALYPGCIGTGFPNFSYAEAVLVGAGGFACTGLNSQYVPPPLTVTWYYYATYPPATCGNPSLPNGDQCCHSTSTSTITFYNTVFVNLLGNVVGTSTGNVTAGAFLGQSATWVITKPTLTSISLNCNTAYGQEATVGTTSLVIASGPNCQNGGQFGRNCPGSH